MIPALKRLRQKDYHQLEVAKPVPVQAGLHSEIFFKNNIGLGRWLRGKSILCSCRPVLCSQYPCQAGQV